MINSLQECKDLSWLSDTTPCCETDHISKPKQRKTISKGGMEFVP